MRKNRRKKRVVKVSRLLTWMTTEYLKSQNEKNLGTVSRRGPIKAEKNSKLRLNAHKHARRRHKSTETVVKTNQAK